MLRSLPSFDPTWEGRTDVVVVGAGAAGLSAALCAASGGERVLLVSKGIFGSGSTQWAQGGLAATLSADDSAELHAADTRTAGAGMCDDDAVRELTAGAPAEIAALQDLGADFDYDTGNTLDLAREGGHSRHRVVHAGGDASGAEVSRALWSAVDKCDQIHILEPAVALDLVLSPQRRVTGVLVGGINPIGRDLKVGVVHAGAVVLATGGVGQLYSCTTNPPGATGDGLAIAARAGAQLADLEFVQFHPTVLWADPSANGQHGLITEALRGAGAHLLDSAGARFMVGHHPLAELAPRDVVAAGMQEVMAQSDVDHLWLDARMVDRELMQRHFPTVLDICHNAGIDPLGDLIPVAPGAHYFCGGVRTDLDGRTTIAGLFAVGEVACTGVHGANRLASNSLTEAIHFGRRAGKAIGEGAWTSSMPHAGTATHDIGLSTATVDPSARAAITAEMTRNAGVMRSASSLEEVLDALDSTAPAQQDAVLTLDDIETCALHTCATLIASAALLREESRGCHRRSDFPAPRSDWQARHITLGVSNQVVHAREQIPA
jgi:L-aspartate oxidase